MRKVLLILILLALVGCNETQKVPETEPKIKPLNAHILPAPQKWKDAYGDTLETQLVFNAVVGGRDDKILQNAAMQIAGVIRNAHAADPNDVIWRESVDVRLDALEVDIPEAIKFTAFGDGGIKLCGICAPADKDSDETVVLRFCQGHLE